MEVSGLNIGVDVLRHVEYLQHARGKPELRVQRVKVRQQLVQTSVSHRRVLQNCEHVI